jgi:uncharacterized membrane protein YeaQ/YmgE (transglycosylase-associated protein family)
MGAGWSLGPTLVPHHCDRLESTFAPPRGWSAHEAWSKEKSHAVTLWIVDGLVAAYVAGRIMSSEGRDWVMDMVMGVAGGTAGGFLLSATHLVVRGAMIYTSLGALAGAALLVGLSRSFSGRREYGSTD